MPIVLCAWIDLVSVFPTEKATCRVRKVPGWPRSWANSSPLNDHRRIPTRRQFLSPTGIKHSHRPTSSGPTCIFRANLRPFSPQACLPLPLRQRVARTRTLRLPALPARGRLGCHAINLHAALNILYGESLMMRASTMWRMHDGFISYLCIARDLVDVA